MILLSFCSMPWWLSWLLPFLLGLLAGWAIWSKWKKMYADMNAYSDELTVQINSLENDLKECKKVRSELDGNLALARGMVRELEASVANYKNELKSTQGGSFVEEEKKEANTKNSRKPDKKKKSSNVDILKGNLDSNVNMSGIVSSMDSNDQVRLSESGSKQYDQGMGESSIYSNIQDENLQIIEGIGPKMSSILKDNGVHTIQDLSSKSTEEIQAILDSYGDKYKIIDSKTWVQQATYATNREWDTLIDYQKRLDGGVPNAKGMTEAKLEKVLIKMGVLRKFKQDDLKAIEGIGPAIEKLFHEARITTWRELANTTVSRLQQILDDAGKRFKLADPATWPRQAELAADGKFKELQEYQDFLDGGRE